MNNNCSNFEQALRTSDGKYFFRSMGDVRRATESFKKNPKDPVALEVINAYRHFRLHCLNTSLSIFGNANKNRTGLVSARLKRIKSIRRKLIRGQKGAVNEMNDVLGIRVICQSFCDANELVSNIQQVPGSVTKDYLTNPHPANTGYRAQHVILRFDQPFLNNSVTARFEVQIRTWLQHKWACWSESYGERAKEGFIYKSSHPTGDYELISKLHETSRVIAEWEHAHPQVIQQQLPEIHDLYSISVAWFNAQKRYIFDSFDQSITRAVEMLYHLESIKEFEPILLVGVARPKEVQRLLQETHPKFMRPSFLLDPKFWLPTN